MKTFVELVTEIKKSFDNADDVVRTLIENDVETTSIATASHTTGSYLIYNKKLYKVTDDIAVGDTLDPTPTTGNIEESDDIMSMVKDEAKTRGILGAKNLFHIILGGSRTHRGVTFILNSDGTVTANGTADGGTAFAVLEGYLGKGNYILNGCPSGGSSNTYSQQLYDLTTGSEPIDLGEEFGDGLEFTLSTDTRVRCLTMIRNGQTVSNLTFKPMIRLATDLDNTYQPYSHTNQELTGEVISMLNVLGAKNLLPNNAMTRTINGITFTVNSDGTILVNGTYSSYTYFRIATLYLDAGDYYLSGVNGLNLALGVYDDENDTWIKLVAGEDTSFHLDARTQVDVDIVLESYATGGTNLLVKPMLRPASIKDDTYVPYSMTNREMTPYVQAISNPNLLDNPWFTVNQRGQSSYSATGYTVDRWKHNASTGTTTVNSDGSLTIAIDSTRHFAQLLESDLCASLVGKRIAISVNCVDVTGVLTVRVRYTKNNAYYGQIILGSIHTNGIHSISGIIPSDADPSGMSFEIYGNDTSSNSFTIKAVKLELGSVSTLAMDTAPNYATELLKCQRYFVRYSGYFYLGKGQAYNATTCNFNTVIPETMRAKPTITTSLALICRKGATDISATDVGVTAQQNGNLWAYVTASGLTAGEDYYIINPTNGVIDLSADL